MARTLTAALVLVLLGVSYAGAQSREYLDHRNPPAGVDFNAIAPGTPSPAHPGFTIEHDGKGWYLAPIGTPSPGPVPVPPAGTDCAGVDPYVDPDRAWTCGLQNVPKNVPSWLPTFRVGGRYFGGYEEYKMVVLSIGRTIDGVEVITFQWLTDNTRAKAGDLGTCKNDGRGAFTSCGMWLPSPPQ